MPDTLTLLSYNTHLFGEGLAFPSYYDTRRTPHIAAALGSSGADVIGLSEVWDDDLADRICREVRSTHPHTYRPPFSVSGLKTLGSGLLLLSRYPFVEGSRGFAPFENLVVPDNFSDKGVARAVVELPGHQAPHLVVLLTHTQASYAGEPNTFERQQNIRQVALWASNLRFEYPDAAVAVLGDLNVVAEDRHGNPTSEYRQTRDKLDDLADLYRHTRPDATTAPGYTYDGANNSLIPVFAPDEVRWRQRIDYHFAAGPKKAAGEIEVEVVREGFTFEADGKTMDLSDHYPLRSRWSGL